MSDTNDKILVVDDDTSLLETLDDFLSFEGYEVMTAADGEQGLALLAKRKPDLMILDISMPGMGGIAVLKELSSKPETADLPVYIFTARDNMEDFFSETDVAGFMAKPCNPSDLLRDIRGILAVQTEDGAPVVAAGSVTGRKILLAEDEPLKRDRLLAAFEKNGCRTVVVATGAEVVERRLCHGRAVCFCDDPVDRKPTGSKSTKPAHLFCRRIEGSSGTTRAVTGQAYRIRSF